MPRQLALLFGFGDGRVGLAGDGNVNVRAFFELHLIAMLAG
jgi:hypothetical protein